LNVKLNGWTKATSVFEKIIKVVGERSRCATIAYSRKSNWSTIGTTRELKKHDVFFP
jgi:hypothetical protein